MGLPFTRMVIRAVHLEVAQAKRRLQRRRSRLHNSRERAPRKVAAINSACIANLMFLGAIK